MKRASILRAVSALVVALSGVGLTVSRAGFPAVAGGIGVLVGVPGAIVELSRAVVPIVVALLVAAVAIRFGIRALWTEETLVGDLARGGKLLGTTAYAAFAWLVLELFYRQEWLGWATVFGSLGASLAWSALAVALSFVAERLVPWSKAPPVVRQLGLLVVAALAVATAWSAWCHRDVVPRLALIAVALVGLGLMVSGVRRIERDQRGRTLVELTLALTLLSGPLWRLFS